MLREAESEAESRRAEGAQCGMEVPKVGRRTTEGPVAGWRAKPPAHLIASLLCRDDIYQKKKNFDLFVKGSGFKVQGSPLPHAFAGIKKKSSSTQAMCCEMTQTPPMKKKKNPVSTFQPILCLQRTSCSTVCLKPPTKTFHKYIIDTWLDICGTEQP